MFKHELLEQRVSLARQALRQSHGQPGGAPPQAACHALDTVEPQFNCANFLPYLLGIAAHQGPNGELFFNAEHIYADATGPHSMFTSIDLPVPGCILVVPPGSGDEFVGIVTKAEPLTGIACSRVSIPEPMMEQDFSPHARLAQRLFCVLNTDLH